MPLTYMTHKHHGATHAGDFGEIERLKLHGWQVSDEPTAEQVLEAKFGKKEAAPVSIGDEAPKKPGRPKKAA